jgi:hypothetical protein
MYSPIVLPFFLQYLTNEKYLIINGTETRHINSLSQFEHTIPVSQFEHTIPVFKYAKRVQRLGLFQEHVIFVQMSRKRWYILTKRKLFYRCVLKIINLSVFQLV